MPKKERILLVGGGSGGHIIPNLAVASVIELKNPKAQLLYIASRNKLDAELLKTSHLKKRFIFCGKWRRYFSWQNFVDPFLVILGFFQSVFILISFRPHVVFSKGGYVSLPVVFAAFLMRIPIILHESDSRMGLTNRLTARLAKRVCVAFESLLKSPKYCLTGNPIRSDILKGDAKTGYELTGFDDKLPVLLVWGGSQGAQQINDLLMADLERFTSCFQVIHITGKGKCEVRGARCDEDSNAALHTPHSTLKNYISFEYLGNELRDIYAITDLMIGRAGANSLFEIASLQKPNIIIPLQNSDQRGNAGYFEKKGAAWVYQKGDNLFEMTLDLWQNKALQSQMKKALKELSHPHAAEKIVKLIFEFKELNRSA